VAHAADAPGQLPVHALSVVLPAALDVEVGGVARAVPRGSVCLVAPMSARALRSLAAQYDERCIVASTLLLVVLPDGHRDAFGLEAASSSDWRAAAFGKTVRLASTRGGRPWGCTSTPTGVNVRNVAVKSLDLLAERGGLGAWLLHGDRAVGCVTAKSFSTLSGLLQSERFRGVAALLRR
jgi:hypothetical protein